MSAAKEGRGKDHDKFFSLLEKYQMYKEEYAKNIRFDPESPTLSKSAQMYFITFYVYIIYFPVANLEPSPLQLVQIYFDTATFDEIERDVKMTTEAALGLIGGTMGLLTGFSILSGVEIIYYACKFFISLRTSRVEHKRN